MVIVLVKGAVTLGHLLEVLPLWVLGVELLPVVGQEEDGKDSKEHPPSGPPQAHVVDQGLETHPIVHNIRRQLKVEGQGIRVIGQTVHLGHLLRDGIDFNMLGVFNGPPPEVVLQHLRPNHPKVDGDTFIEALNDEEVVLQIVIAIRTSGVSGNRTAVGLLLDEEEDAAVVG